MHTTLTTHHVRCNHCSAEFDMAGVPDRCLVCKSRDIESTAHTQGLPDLWREDLHEAILFMTVDEIVDAYGLFVTGLRAGHLSDEQIEERCEDLRRALTPFTELPRPAAAEDQTPAG